MQWKKINDEDEAVYDASREQILVRLIGGTLAHVFSVQEFMDVADDGITVDDLPTVT